jgi:hypothetical protein
MRRGDLSAIRNVIYDPMTGQPFPGNVIPENRINPIARRVADIWPLPNRSFLSFVRPAAMTPRSRMRSKIVVLLRPADVGASAAALHDYAPRRRLQGARST